MSDATSSKVVGRIDVKKPFQPAERFPVCEYIQDEIDARGWTRETFALRSGLRCDVVDEILAGRRRLTRITALCVGNAFGVDAGTWLRLQEAGEWPKD